MAPDSRAKEISRQETTGLEEAGAVTAIRLERTPCFGECPTYWLVLTADGHAFYRGSSFVEKLGDHVGSVSNADFKRLADMVMRSNFFSLDDDYFVMVTDCSSVYTTVWLEEESKTTRDYAKAGPAELQRLERFIDRMASEISWQPSVIDRDTVDMYGGSNWPGI